MKDLGGKAKAATASGWLANPSTPAEAELRQALDQAAGREADEVALRRVWARLAENPTLVPFGDADLHERVDEARGRRVRWPWILVASLAGATATLAFMLVETHSEFRADRANGARVAAGNAVLATPGANGTSSDERSTLVAPATVRTGFGETLNLSLRGGTHVTVTSESTLVLDRNDHPAVSAGEVQFNVPRQPAGQSFTVAAGSYRVVVVGTRFRVRVSQSNAAVGVDEGVVEIWTDRRIARVTAGESWVSSTGSEPAGYLPQPSPAVTKAVAATSSPITPSPPAARSNGGRSAARRSDSASLGLSRSSSIGSNRQVVAMASPSSLSSSPAPGAKRSSYVGPAAATGSPISVPASKDTVAVLPARETAPTLAPSPTALDGQPLAVQARLARAAGDSRRALGLYRALARKGGTAGENAEYEIGRLLRDGLNQPREAVSAWRAYRAQHPRGLLRVEADISVIETLVAMGDKTAAVAEASDFIRRYPDSERRAEIARLAGDLLRERSACADAVGAYDIALDSAHIRKDVSDGAAFQRAVCLFRGDNSDGGKALQSYLVSFPGGRFRNEAQRLLNRSHSSSSANLPPR